MLYPLKLVSPEFTKVVEITFRGFVEPKPDN